MTGFLRTNNNNRNAVSRINPYILYLYKASDTVGIEELWKILHKIGCPEKLIAIIRPFHECMKSRATTKLSDTFNASNRAKQGCVVAPTLFGIVFAVMLQYAFRNLYLGVHLHVRCDSGIFNIRRFSARTKLT